MFEAKGWFFSSGETRNAAFHLHLKRAAKICVVMPAVLWLNSCAGLVKSNSQTTPTPITISVSPTNPGVQVSQSQNFTATVQNDSSSKGVTWSLSGAGCSGAACGVLSNASALSVTYIAPSTAPSPANFTLTATSVADVSKSASTTITINVPAISVSVNPPSASVQVSQSMNFTASVQNDSQSKGVSWSLSASGCSGNACGTLTNVTTVSLTYSAPARIPNPATVILTVTSVADNSKKATATITVTSAPPPISVLISPTSASVQVATTQQFTAAVQNDSSNQGVSWQVNGVTGGTSTFGTISTNGLYTAPSSAPNPATFNVSAVSKADNTKLASARVTVSTTPPPSISVSVSPTSNSVQVSTSANFTASVQNDTQNNGVNWSLVGGGCTGASCGTLSATTSASGTAITYTAPASVPTPATVTLTATSVTDTTKSAAATITVMAAPVIIVTVSPATANVQASIGTQSFTASVQNDTQNKGVNWSLSGAGCNGATCGTLSATTSASGAAITYAAPVSVPTPATVTLTATSGTDGTKISTATLTVTAAISVSVAPTTASGQVSQAKSFTATIQNDTQNKGVNWTLSGAGCIGATCGSLSATSSASGVAITYTAPGSVPTPATVRLTATSITDGTKTAAATITVTVPPAIILIVSPVSANIQAGIGSQNFTATVQNDSQNKGVNWSLSGAGCSGATCGTLSATSSASGAAITYTAPSAVPALPTVTLTATSVMDGTKTTAATITITAPISVTVAPMTANVQVNQPQTFTATVSNDSQNKGVNWSLTGAGCGGATCGSLSATSSASGAGITYTAPTSLPAPATVTLTAKSVTDNIRTAAATLIVTATTGNISVSISPKRGGLTLSQTMNLTATVTNDIGSAGVTWSATAGTFSTQNTAAASYVAPNSAGVVTVTATSVADVTKSASATIGVTNLAGVTTYHNDLSRDGANTQEYALTTSNVSTATFGKLFSCPVDAPAYAQPLWVSNLNIGGGTHNVIFAATSHDTVYAFDADTSPCVTYWQKSLNLSSETFVNSNDVNTTDIFPDIGIVGTPIIDAVSKTLYVVTKSKDQGSSCSPSTSCHQRLHALSLVNGNEKFGGPADITPSIAVPGTGDGSSGGSVAFNPLTENQRPGLALVNGVVYITWASHGDNDPYHGWVIGYAAANLAQAPVVYNTSPNGSRSGIWMSGGAPAADSGNNLYMITGNGTYDGAVNSDYGDTFLKLSTSGGISVADWFTPANQSSLEGGDNDFGAGGAAILVDQPSSPVPHLVIGGGKEGNLFLLNRDNMGKFNSTNQVVQILGFGQSIFATAAFWNNSLYLAGVGGPLKTYSFNATTGKFNTSPTSQSLASYNFPGATPSVSSTGTTNGIVWAIDSSAYGTPCCSNGPAILHAHDANNLATELWNSSQGSSNAAGNAVKFTVPTIANGKVYVGTRSEIDVFGLLP
jgi:hypothetical protein